MFAYLGIFISALIGSGVAALADLLQKDTAGAVVKLQTTLASLLGLNLQTLWAVAILMILGAALCFVFQPQSRQAGFALGLSVISVVMTATPTKPPASPAGIHAGLSAPSATLAMLPIERGLALDWPLIRVQQQQNLLRLNFQVMVKDSPPGPLGEVTIRARELPSGRIWQWTTDQFVRQLNYPIQFYYDIPVSAGTTIIETRLESQNYGTGTASQPVGPGLNQVNLAYGLSKSSLPTVLDKLLETRKF